MASREELLNRCVDAICQNGCEVVRATIAAIECGDSVAQAELLDEAERQKLLVELKAIMAVYDVR